VLIDGRLFNAVGQVSATGFNLWSLSYRSCLSGHVVDCLAHRRPYRCVSRTVPCNAPFLGVADRRFLFWIGLRIINVEYETMVILGDLK
jgi:hypothetical protein